MRSPLRQSLRLALKPDIGQVWAPKTVSFQKIAALCSASTELLNDFSMFNQFMVNDLTRAVIDAETDFIVSHATNGLIWQAEYGLPNPALSRQVGADTPLDALERAVDDIRVGSAYGTADKIALHPNTLGYLKRQKSSLNTYLLNPNPQTGNVDKIWNMDVIQNSKIPMNYAIVWDSSQAILGWTRQALTVATNPYATAAWSNNYLIFRAEERIAVGYPRPTAINIVTGFPGGAGS